MTRVFRPDWNRLETGFLPRICASPRCTNDPAHQSRWCQKCIDAAKRGAALNRRADSIYALKAGAHYKFGFSAFPPARTKELQTGSPFTVQLLGSAPGDQRLEKMIHQTLCAFRARGEWFRDCESVRRVADAIVSGNTDAVESVLRKVRDGL